MAIVLIDEHEIEIPDDQRLNAIEAAALAGIEIPHYCWHPALSVAGSCRMCLIETGTRDAASGKISMMPKLVPACNTPVRDGTVVVTQSETVARARAMVEEDLLLHHPIDCPVCDKAGECNLQDYHFLHGRAERRADLRPTTSRRRDLGDIALFVDRCVNCTRCVRFTREISGTAELMVAGRGAHAEIDVMAGFPLANKLSGNVVDLCPVGAMGDKDFLYKQRVWFLDRRPSLCTACSTGCSIWVEENQDRVHRIKPRENPHVNGWWICNDGRYDYPHVHHDKRLARPRVRKGTEWKDAVPGELAASLNAELGNSGPLAAIFSPMLTVEEAYLLAKRIREHDAEAPLVLGPIPTAGEDERFPNGFSIGAEKCPNRRGVEMVLAHFAGKGGKVISLEEFLPRLDDGKIRGAWVSGGYRRDWIDSETAARFGKLSLLVVQDLFDSPLLEHATYRLPAGAYAERDGSYVNRADHLQSVERAIRPPIGVLPEGPLLWGLSGREGLYDARAVLTEVASEISYFRVAAEPVPELGVNLKVNLLADAAAGESNA